MISNFICKKSKQTGPSSKQVTKECTTVSYGAESEQGRAFEVGSIIKEMF